MRLQLLLAAPPGCVWNTQSFGGLQNRFLRDRIFLFIDGYVIVDVYFFSGWWL